MYDDFTIYETCEEYYSEEEWEESEEDYEDWEEDEDEEREDFPDDYLLEQGFNPYMGCYDWDC